MESPRATSATRRGRRRADRPRRRVRLYTSLPLVAAVGATAAGAVYVKAHARDNNGTVSSAASPSPSSSASANGEASVEPVTEPAVDRDALLSKALKTVTVPSGAKVSAA